MILERLESSETKCLEFAYMNIEANYVVGLFDALGNFYVKISYQREDSSKSLFVFRISLIRNVHDIQLLHALKRYFKCGKVVKIREDQCAYKVENKDHLLNIVVPFFEKHLLKSKKRIVFQKFRKILILFNKRLHASEEGYKQIKSLKREMDLIAN